MHNCMDTTIIVKRIGFPHVGDNVFVCSTVSATEDIPLSLAQFYIIATISHLEYFHRSHELASAREQGCRLHHLMCIIVLL